jgi:hypothetical protein
MMTPKRRSLRLGAVAAAPSLAGRLIAESALNSLRAFERMLAGGVEPLINDRQAR